MGGRVRINHLSLKVGLGLFSSHLNPKLDQNMQGKQALTGPVPVLATTVSRTKYA